MHYLQVLALIKKIEGTRNLHYSIILLISFSAEVKRGPHSGKWDKNIVTSQHSL